MNNNHKTKRFSLIELLVVIAIIGILASFLAPMLSKSRGEARKAVCVSQQKQISISNFMYLDDNDNQFLPRTMGYNGNNYYRGGGHRGGGFFQKFLANPINLFMITIMPKI